MVMVKRLDGNILIVIANCKVLYDFLFYVLCSNWSMQYMHTSHIDVMDNNHQTVLHHACKGGNIEVIQYLVLQLKSDIGKTY